MKNTPKENVNIVELVDEFIDIMNKRSAQNNVPNVYEVSIKNGTTKSPNAIGVKKGKKNNKWKTLIITVADINTRKRTTLFSMDWVYHNSAELLSVSYKKILYREFLFNSSGMYLLNAKAVIDQREEVETKKKLKENAIKPLAPEEAINPKDFSTLD